MADKTTDSKRASADSETQPCRLCGSNDSVRFLLLSGMPRWNHRLISTEDLTVDYGIDLHVRECTSCGFVSLPLCLDHNYYDDYILLTSRSPQAQEFQVRQAKEFVSRFGLFEKKILEVGCGDGFFLQALADAGSQVVGIEPSYEQCNVARERGLHVEQGLLMRGQTLSQGPFDGFVTRQVFEHVEDMQGFLLAIRENLASSAVGLVEVPNLDKLVSEDRFYDFIPEHLNYFSSRTLNVALSLAGFEVLEIEAVDDAESLRALVRWTAPIGGSRIQTGVDRLRCQFDDFVFQCRENRKRVALWGAGGKGLSIMAVLDLDPIEVVVDGDPEKTGRWTPVSHQEVFPPSELAARGIEAIIVTAPAYQFEIARYLRQELKFHGLIALAGSKFQIFNEFSAS